jgi:1-aminocyclopropane-1-carboxylate deaminase
MFVSSSLPSIEKSVIDLIPNSNNIHHHLFALRDDLIHNIISGNKWRKLKFAFDRIEKEHLKGVQTFGGAFSNHLLAVACSAKLHQLPSRIFVRGEELTFNSNEVLNACHSMGAQLHFLSREVYYRQKSTYGITEDGFLSIPEGGACKEGLMGVLEMGKTLLGYDVVAVAQGSGTTSLGLLLSTPASTALWVFPVLKGFNSLLEMQLLADKCGFSLEFQAQKHRVQVKKDYTFGGYAKGEDSLLQEIKHLGYKVPFPLDYVYTGKAFVGFMKESEKETGQKKMLFIHTGGYALSKLTID